MSQTETAIERTKLTDTKIKNLKPSPLGRITLSDEEVNGLCLRMGKSGRKSFSLNCRVAGAGDKSRSTGRKLYGKQRRFTLGTYPAMSLAEARAKAREIKTAAEAGVDYFEEIQAEAARQEQAERAAKTPTVSEVAALYIEREAKPRLVNWKTVARCFDMHICSKWGDRELKDITRPDIHGLLDDLIDADAIGTAREARKNLSRLMNWAADRGIILANPVQGMRISRLQANEEAGRDLTDAELRAFWKATGELRYPWQQFFRLLLLTGARRNEWTKTRTSHLSFDDKWIEIPRNFHKSRRGHIIPLSDEACEVLATMPTWAGDDPYIFSTMAGERPVSGFSKAKLRLDDAMGDPAPFRIHDLRVTVRSRLAYLGIADEIAEEVIGHARKGLVGVYNKYSYINEKRDALNTWAAHLMEVVGER